MKRRALAERAAQETPVSGDKKPALLRVITISRQAGSGGRTLGPRIAAALNFQFVDRQILDLVVKNTGARERLINSLDERTRNGIDLWVEGILTRRYVDRSEYAHWLAKTITVLAEDGESVILGRAGNVILGRRGGLHVRVVAPKEVRIQNLVEFDGLSTSDAQARVERLDYERRRFYHEYFDADINNPQDYHLIINTGRVDIESAAEIVLVAWKRYQAAQRP
jgi:cytidylate kinase